MAKRMFVFCMVWIPVIGLFAQSGVGADSVQVKEIQPYSYVAVEMKGSYSQHEQAFGILYGSAGQQGIALMNAPMGIYYNSPREVIEDSLLWELGVAVGEMDSVTAPLKLKTWSYSPVAVLAYEGPFGPQVEAAYGRLFGWIAQSGYQVAGPVCEQYLSMPQQDENGVLNGKLEIVVPVKKQD